MVPRNSDSDQVLTREEAASFIGLAPATLATWATRYPDRIPLVKHSARRVGYRLGDLREYIARCRSEGGSV